MTTPDVPSTPAADDLRQRFIEALDRSATVPSATRPGLYDVMLAAVQPELDQLRAQVAHQGAYITSQGDQLADMERDRDRYAADAATLAAMFDGLHALLGTSSRDWGSCRVDAWLYAVLVGWGCKEQHEHDDVCGGGAAMEEMAVRHGWSAATVAQARRYRAAVRATLAGPAATVGEPQCCGPKKYPLRIGAYCDSCNLRVVHDYVISDAMGPKERSAAARAHLRTAEGWSCTDDADLCPQCASASA